MPLKDHVVPHPGVTVLEAVGGKKSTAAVADPKVNQTGKKKVASRASSIMKIADETSKETYQVFKRGKPYTKLASNDASPRMTRENYFKIAEQQGLATMREDMISILGGPSEHDKGYSTRKSGNLGDTLKNASFSIGTKPGDATLSKLIALENSTNSLGQSTGSNTNVFKRRH